MKRAFLIILTSLCGFILVCCSKVDAFEQQPCSDMISNHFISEHSAISVATSFMEECIGQNLTKASGTVKEVFTIGENDAAYVINYEGGGFSIVASDDRMEPVLGYSETGHIDNNEDLFPEGFKLWIRKISAEEEYLNGNDIPQTEEMNALWNKYQGIAFTKSIQPNPDHELLDELVGPLLTDSWTQGDPYNQGLTPRVFEGDQTTGIPKIGCTPLALARVFRFHQYPSRFDWAHIYGNTPSSALTELFNDLHDSFKQEQCISFHSRGTEILYSWCDYENFLANYYGYQNVHCINYNYNNASHRDIIRTELISHQRPVLLNGWGNIGNNTFGHVWVCDGAHNYETAVYNENTGETFIYGYLYFHHAWGDETIYDCWLSSSTVQTTNANYNQNLKLIYNINPNSWLPL